MRGERRLIYDCAEDRTPRVPVQSLPGSQQVRALHCLPPKGIMRPYPAKNKYEAESVDSKDRPEAASFSRAEGASASSTTRCHTPPRRDTGLRTTARGCIDWVPVATAEHFTSRDCALLRHTKGVQHIDSFLVTGTCARSPCQKQGHLPRYSPSPYLLQPRR